MNRVVLFGLFFFFIVGIFVFVAGVCSVGALPLVEDSWSSKAPMPQARSGLGVAAVDGKIYAIGGTATGLFAGEHLGVNEMYDPISDTWTTLASMPTPRMNFDIVVCEGKIYCIGGIVGRTVENVWGMKSYSFTYTNRVEVYDPVANNWSRRAPAPYSIVHTPAVVVNGQIFVLADTSLSMYDPLTDVWSAKAPMPATPQSEPYPVLFVIDNKIIVTGKFESDNPYRVDLNNFSTYDPPGPKVLVYDPENDVWGEEGVGPMVFCSGVGLVTSGVYAPQRVYFLGSSPGSTFGEVITNQAYDFSDNTWRIGTDVPNPRVDFGAVVLDDLLYVIGGTYSVGGHSASVEVFVPFGFRSVPVVGVVLPFEGAVYNELGVELVFVVDRPFSQLYYCVDGGANVVVGGNTTLSGLSCGVHNVTVFAEDRFGNVGVSETVTFTVASDPSNLFLSIPILAVLGVAVVIAAGVVLAVFFRRRHVPL